MSTIAVIPDEQLQIVPSMPERQEAAALVVRDLQDLILDDRQHFAWRDAGEHAGDRVRAGRSTGMKLMTRDEKQQRGKQREKEVARELRGEAEAVVCHDLDARSA